MPIEKKVPKAITFVTELPKTATGKIEICTAWRQSGDRHTVICLGAEKTAPYLLTCRRRYPKLALASSDDEQDHPPADWQYWLPIRHVANAALLLAASGGVVDLGGVATVAGDLGALSALLHRSQAAPTRQDWPAVADLYGERSALAYRVY